MKNQENKKKIFSNLQIKKIIKNTLSLRLSTIKLKSRNDGIGNMKYFPSFSKEWRNTIYSFNKKNLFNLPINDLNINKLIQSYFNLFFKYKFRLFSKFRRLRERRTFLRRIFISDAEIKHTNDKVKITLYAINKEKKVGVILSLV